MTTREPIPAKPAIQSDEQAGIEAQEYKYEVAAIKQIDIAEKAALEALAAVLKEQFDLLRKPRVEARDERFARVQAWAEATRNGRQTIKFPNGRQFRWRTEPYPKVIVAGTLVTIIASLIKRPDWKKYLEPKLKKTALAANPQVVDETEGLRLEPGEYPSIG